jgi:hypothetical protein
VLDVAGAVFKVSEEVKSVIVVILRVAVEATALSSALL